MEAVNRSLGLKLQPVELRSRQYDVETAFRDVVPSRPEGLFVLETVYIFRQQSQIAQLALKHRLPTSFAFGEYVDAGGLVSYGVNFLDMDERAATTWTRSSGALSPAISPSSSRRSSIKTAKALGLTLPQSVLQRADQVIE